MYEKLKNRSIQSFNNACFSFSFCFLLLSINILHVTNILHVKFYTYICYWNTFPYKDIKITFHDVKQSHEQVTLKYICLLFVIFAYLYSVFSFAKSNLRENFFTLLQHSLTFLLFAFITKITWHLCKVNNNVNTDRVSNWTDVQFLCLGFTSFNVPPC